MTKNEFLNLSTEEIINLLNTSNLARQKIDDKNVFSLIFKHFSEDKIIEILEGRNSILNEKNEDSILFVEYLADLGKSEVLEHYASSIDLLKKDYQGEKNMLGYLARKGMKNVILKALDYNPRALNEKDPVGCVGTERLADSGYEDVLVKFAEHIDLLKKDYEGQRNMLGYLAKKGMLKAIDGALENNPNSLNEKDSVGCVGIERLADVNAKNLLEKYAFNIDLLKKDYEGQRNMLGYLAKKGMKDVIEKCLENNPRVLNEKDSVGCVGTERLADSNYEDLLVKFAEHIDLLKRDYEGQYNMLGYLARKKMFNALSAAIKNNPNSLNEKDAYSCLGVERLADAGYSKIILEHAEKIVFNRNATDGQTMFQYVMKKAGADAKNIALKVTSKNADVLTKNLKYIIDSELHDILSYKEIIGQLDKNMKIEDMNLLTYLTKKSRESYVVLMLNPEMVKKSYFNEREEDIDKIEVDKKSDIQIIKESIKPLKTEYELSKKEIEKEEPKSIKARIKSML